MLIILSWLIVSFSFLAFIYYRLWHMLTMCQYANKASVSSFQNMSVVSFTEQPLEAVELIHSGCPEARATTQLMLQCAYIMSPNIVYSPSHMSKWLWQALLITSHSQIALYTQTSCTGNPLTAFSRPLQFKHTVKLGCLYVPFMVFWKTFTTVKAEKSC